MSRKKKTYLFCYDDYRGFTEDIRKKFPDTSRYTVLSFQTQEELINNIEEKKEHNFCKVAILGVHDTKEQFELIDHLTTEIKKADQRTGIILLGSVDKMDEIRKFVKFNIDAYIPKNANSILRIHNAVKKLISEHNIGIFRKRRNLSYYMVLLFFLLSALLILISYFKLPQYF